MAVVTHTQRLREILEEKSKRGKFRGFNLAFPSSFSSPDPPLGWISPRDLRVPRPFVIVLYWHDPPL